MTSPVPLPSSALPSVGNRWARGATPGDVIADAFFFSRGRLPLQVTVVTWGSINVPCWPAWNRQGVAQMVYGVRTKMVIRDGIRLKHITYSYPYLSHLTPETDYTTVAFFVLVCCTTTHHSSYAKPIWKVVSHVLGKALLVERLGLFRFALSVRLGTL